MQNVIEAGVVRRLVELLGHQEPAVQTPALRTVGHIASGNELQTQILVDCGALRSLLRLLSSHKKSIRKEACWVVSNITAGNKEQIKHVIESGLIPPLVQLLARADFDVKKEAAWAISNVTSGGQPEQIRYLVSQQCIRPLCDLLVAHDARIINVGLEGIENILRVGEDDKEALNVDFNEYAGFVEKAEGLDKLEALQSHSNDQVYERAIKILETYFCEETSEDPAAIPELIQSLGEQLSLCSEGGARSQPI